MIAEMKEARRALSAVSLPNGVYAIGGYNGSVYLKTVERYDPENGWVPVASMNNSWCTLSTVSASDCRHIYAIAGFNG
jgi:influenza virus NS1A-binding protein